MPLKAIKRKIKRNGKTITIKFFKDGAEGTGVTLPYVCGFCNGPNNEVRFRSRHQRTDHTRYCPK